MKTLGLDLGSNSLGWAILDDEGCNGKFTEKGVVVFPEGILPDDTLKTPAAIRREARMARRLKFRRKIRKWALLKTLIENGLCPLKQVELDAWKKEGRYPIANKAFLAWLKATDTSNPYIDRARAAEEKVEPFTLGRALYHIIQRRGFKSSRKDAVDSGEESDKKSQGADPKLGVVKAGIAKLSEEIDKSGCKTLGQYFFKCLEEERGKPNPRRIRKQYTGRIEHYEKEFEVIAKVQGIAQDSVLWKRLHNDIFMQRPLRSQKNLVGPCPLEPKSPRCMIGHPDFEEFRMLCFVNNLRFVDKDGNKTPLNDEQREKAKACFQRAAPAFKFAVIRKALRNDGELHYYRDDQSVSSCSTRYRIQTAFGSVPYNEQTVFDALTFFDDDGKLTAWFVKHYPALPPESVKKLVAIHPKEGNAQYSLKAIRKILPWLRRGYEPSFARFLAKLPEVLPAFQEHEKEIIAALEDWTARCRKNREDIRLLNSASHIKPLRLYEDCFWIYLNEKWGMTQKQWESLYLRGDAIYEAEKTGRIPKVELGMIRNPLVQRAMTTLRRLVNYLHDHHKIDRDTVVRIELARSVNDYATRHAYQAWQKLHEDARDAARAKLGPNASDDAIDRCILWEEQNHKCFYTGRNISLEEILVGNTLNIEHTVPRCRSGDDSLANKTLCDAAYNQNVKMGRIPTECPNYAEACTIKGENYPPILSLLKGWEEKKEQLEKDYSNQSYRARTVTNPTTRSMARIKALTTRFELNYWRDKIRRFHIAADQLVDPADGLCGFKRRQLVDTGIMCSHAVALLKSVYEKTFPVNGAATAFARKAWGIQGDEAKDRSDHTHHAVDAMVIAALNPARFNAICAALKDDGSTAEHRPCDVCKPPFDGFADAVRHAAGEILVKHITRQTTLRPSQKRTTLAKGHWEKGVPGTKWIKHVLSCGDTVRGALHKDTFYGCIHKPGENAAVFVVRKPLTGSAIGVNGIAEKIIDPAIKAIVLKQLEKYKQDGVKNFVEGMFTMPSGVPINKVRIEAHTTNPATLRAHATPSKQDYKTPYYVTSAENSNFRLALFKTNGRFSVVPDNSLAWAKDHKSESYQPLDQKPGFIGYIVPGSMALAYSEGHPEELFSLDKTDIRKRLYKVIKFEATGRITFRFHSEARDSTILKQDLIKIGKHGAGESAIDLQHPHELLLLSPKKFFSQMLFENIDFRMKLDGTIEFLKRKEPNP